MVNKTKKRNVLNAVRLKDTSRQEPETKTSSDLKEDPHDFNYEPNEELLKLIDDALNQSLPDDESKCEVVREAQERLGQIINEQTEHDLKQLSYDHLEQVHKFLQRILSSYDLYFYQCLQMCQQHARPQSKNRELAERLKDLKLKQSQNYYKQITGQVQASRGEFQIREIGNDLKEVNTSLIAIANGFLVVIGTFVFVYKAVEYSIFTPDIPLQVLAAFLASLIVAVAELYWIFKII